VSVLFQPAEENGEGAKAMLEDSKFDKHHPDYIFALHNLPAYRLHDIVVKENTFTAAVTSILIELKGRTSHAAEPEHGDNPALAIAEIIQECIALENNHADREDMKVITPVFIEMGEKAYGISAGEGSVHFTIRCWNDENLLQFQNQIEDISKRIGKTHKLNISFDYTQTFHANQNNTEATDLVRNSAKEQKLNLTERGYPFKWGEDFGLFTSKFKGCMFGLGSGETMPALHNPDYDFPDELIPTGVKIFSGIIKQINQVNT
jgi:amidohydrolase